MAIDFDKIDRSVDLKGLQADVEDAKKNGEAVKAPVEVEASRNSNTAPTVKVELPKGTGETKVEIPVSNVKPGTVAVLVHPDGTEEIVKNSLPTEDGIQLTINGGATVKIVDNSKDFIDTRNHWAKDEISIAYNNGWITGYPNGTFGPQRDITRAETMTLVNRVLNRQPETEDDLLPNMTVWTDNANPKAWYYLAVQEATNSHYYEFKTNSQYEKWTELRETRDGSQLEK